MSEILALLVLFVLVFGGAIGCGIKALLGIEQHGFLPKKFANELRRWVYEILAIEREYGTVAGNLERIAEIRYSIYDELGLLRKQKRWDLPYLKTMKKRRRKVFYITLP